MKLKKLKKKICENNRKSDKIMHCVEEKKISGGFEDRPILWTFYTNLSLETIYLQNYVKNGLIFKTTNQKKISTQYIILLLFLLFSQIKIGELRLRRIEI